MRCWAEAWGVTCSGIGIACTVITWPCHVIKIACFHRRTGQTFGEWGGQGRAWGGWVELEWCACTYWPVLARRKAAAWASEGTATFLVWPWPLHPSTPMYAAEGTEGEGEGQASWAGRGRGAVSQMDEQLAGTRMQSSGRARLRPARPLVTGSGVL